MEIGRSDCLAHMQKREPDKTKVGRRLQKGEALTQDRTGNAQPGDFVQSQGQRDMKGIHESRTERSEQRLLPGF